MFVRFARALLPAAFLLGAPCLAHAQNPLRLVAIERSAGARTTTGVGILRPRHTGECFVVTPRHVADPETGGAMALGPRDTRDPLVSMGDRFSEDVAVWRMARRVDRLNCPAWPSVADVNRTLERAARTGRNAYVLPWTANGAGKRVEVIMDQLTLPRFTIRQAGGALTEGMSGSPVQVDGVVVGILQEVNSNENYGVVLRLDYLERHIGPIFHSSPSPDDAAIYVSTILPGTGQLRTGRVEAGLLWFGLGAGPSAYLFLETRTAQIPRTRSLPDGREETYFETRPVNPHRRYSWIPWVAAGLGSLLEARGHASRYYIPPERSGAEPARRPRLRVRPDVRAEADGATRVQVGELRL